MIPKLLFNLYVNKMIKSNQILYVQVNFSEPISMLQRLTEELEYSEILDQAALCDDSCEQLAWVAAFTVSAYATTLFRTGKPFNPLLGETYEFDRTEDLGWRSLAEQVRHSGFFLLLWNLLFFFSFFVFFLLSSFYSTLYPIWREYQIQSVCLSVCVCVSSDSFPIIDLLCLYTNWSETLWLVRLYPHLNPLRNL